MSSTMNKVTLFAAVLAIASSTSAHMFIQNPVPFSGVSKNPLDPSGSNFPCQGSGYQITSMNEWTVGSDVTVSFPNDQTATHGGGSCQISVTKDQKPTKDSVWKVIHSIEGGCPTTNGGNINNPKDLGSFPFKVPSELPEGEMTMAWTWFNKVGNREMYMNCAPIKVSGGTGKGFDELPDWSHATFLAMPAARQKKATTTLSPTPANQSRSLAQVPSWRLAVALLPVAAAPVALAALAALALAHLLPHPQLPPLPRLLLLLPKSLRPPYLPLLRLLLPVVLLVNRLALAPPAPRTAHFSATASLSSASAPTARWSISPWLPAPSALAARSLAATCTATRALLFLLTKCNIRECVLYG